jgi:asparagine synthase (glutamine-hydrolysing)
MGNEVPYGSWQNAGVRAPEPSVEPFMEMNLKLYRRIAAQARVALTGEGGDAILTGQARSYLGYLLRRGQIGKIVSDFGGYIFNHRRLPFLRTGLRGRFRRWFGSKEREADFPDWIDANFEKQMHLRERWEELKRPLESSGHPLHPEAYASLSSAYWGQLLEDEDAGWSGAPVEVRSPFLDARLIRYLLRVPPLPWCMRKELLREATRGILPEEIRVRPKVPLLEDPLPLLMERGSRTTMPLDDPGGKSRKYVNWLKVLATSSSDTGSVLLEKMRPRVLDHWLKGVEKH